MNKKFFTLKLGIIVFLVVILFIPTTKDVYAEEGSFFEKSYDVVHKFIDEHEYVIAPLSDAIAGGALCGPWGILGGVIFGFIDETLVYFQYTDQRYFTHGILGAATGHMINPSSAATSAGIIVGILLPEGKLNMPQELIAPVVSGLAASSSFGIPGIILGGVGGVIDELLIGSDITDKHYLTSISLGRMSAGLFLPPATANFVAAALGLIASNWEKELCDSLATPLRTVNDLKNIYGKFIPQNELGAHFEKQGIALVSGQLLVQLLSLKAVGFQDVLRNGYENVNNLDVVGWNGVRNTAINFAVFLFPYVLGNVATGFVDSYFDEKLYRRLYDELQFEIYAGRNALQMVHHENYTQLVDSMGESLKSIVYSGNSIASRSFSGSIRGLYGLGMIVVYSPNMVIYNILYNQAKSFVSRYIAMNLGEHDNRVIRLKSDLNRPYYNNIY